MKIPRWMIVLLTFVFLVACGGAAGSGTPTLPTAQVSVTHTPGAEGTLHSYLEALSRAATGTTALAEDYPTMYSLLTQSSRDAISEADFAALYIDALDTMSASEIQYSILSTLTDPQSAQASFQITYKTVLFGDIQRDFNTSLVLENDEWHLPWDTGLILPELAGGKHLFAAHTSPARGDIYDRNGDAIVTQTDAYALGLTSGEVPPESGDELFNLLGRLTGVRPEKIRSDYDNYPPGLYVPVGEASAEAVDASGVFNFSAVQAIPYNSRFYEPNLAPNAVGYTLYISEENTDAYQRLGYSGYERVGVEGIEKWGEEYLHGRNAATLYVVTADNVTENTVAQAESQPASSITLTIDNDLQEQAQAAMDGLPGAIVVMEVDTGRVLTMVSSPGYDPNWYDSNNANAQWMPEPSTFNRSTQGVFPLGSVFKIITMAAALESGVFTPASTIDCQYEFTDIPSHTLYDWTWQRCQDEKAETGSDTCSRPNSLPSGELTLPQGLMRSCDPWFYHIGLELFNQGMGTKISDMARAFGLGRATDVGQVAEAEGQIPDPTDGLDATSIAIGQGMVQVTPLQVATFIAAVANGGTLYRPQLVERIQPVSGEAINVFKPQANSTLPISPENLKVIQDAMREVAANKKGTAYTTLGNFGIPVAAKTGTAESSAADPHAWFAGYSLKHDPTKPDIAVVVLVNYQGEGSIWAAPIFRRIMEIYFYGYPQAVYPWETTYGVVNPDFGQPAPTPTPAPAE